MNPTDPRALRSRQKLADSLLTLSLEQGYDAFNIRELTRHANVGYATFFRHFNSIDGLLMDIFLSAYKELTLSIAQQDSLFNEAVAVYRFVSQHPAIYRVYFSLPPQHPVRAHFEADSKQLILQLAAERDFGPVPAVLSIEYLLECSNLLINWYLDRLDDHTPEQIATMHFDLIIKGIHSDVPALSDSLVE